MPRQCDIAALAVPRGAGVKGEAIPFTPVRQILKKGAQPQDLREPMYRGLIMGGGHSPPPDGNPARR